MKPKTKQRPVRKARTATKPAPQPTHRFGKWDWKPPRDMLVTVVDTGLVMGEPIISDTAVGD